VVCGCTTFFGLGRVSGPLDVGLAQAGGGGGGGPEKELVLGHPFIADPLFDVIKAESLTLPWNFFTGWEKSNGRYSSSGPEAGC
jgi:hypothetical protein